MDFKNRENKCHKTIDGQYVWDSRSVAVVGMIIINHMGEDYVILGKRGYASPNEVGRWCMPCGYLDKDETCEEAVVREIWEESGFNTYEALDAGGVLYNQMDFPWHINSLPNNELQNVSLHYALYFASYGELPKLTIDNNVVEGEVSEVKWVKISDLNNYDLCFNHGSVINTYINNLKVKVGDKMIPTHDPYSGEINPHYELLTNRKNPYNIK